MTENNDLGNECKSAYSNGWEVNPAGTEGVCMVVENIGWGLGDPHGAVMGSAVALADLFGSKGEHEQQVADAIAGTWNRILARNMAFTEGTINFMLSSVREAVSHLEEGSCAMAQQTLNEFYHQKYDGQVPDGLQP